MIAQRVWGAERKEVPGWLPPKTCIDSMNVKKNIGQQGECCMEGMNGEGGIPGA